MKVDSKAEMPPKQKPLNINLVGSGSVSLWYTYQRSMSAGATAAKRSINILLVLQIFIDSLGCLPAGTHREDYGCTTTYDVAASKNLLP